MQHIIYRIVRQPERRVFYTEDIYFPGMSDEERAMVEVQIKQRSAPPTEIQRRIMDMVRNIH